MRLSLYIGTRTYVTRRFPRACEKCCYELREDRDEDGGIYVLFG